MPSSADHAESGAVHTADGAANGATPAARGGRPLDLAAIRTRVAARVVGRDHELKVLLAAIAAGRDLLLEGPPGTSKSTLLREVTREFGVPLVFVEGNAELTTAKLVGHHNPARVLRDDFSADTFVPGPLVEAMRRGGFLYVEEINRAPEDTLNALLTAIAEREITVPRVGHVKAADGFRVVASMNPFDNVGTSRISSSVHDRLCRIPVGYQSAAEEIDIVALRTGAPASTPVGGVSADRLSADRLSADHLAADAVALTRATRFHPEIRQGSSVRGAIDLVLVAQQLLAMEGPPSAGGAPYEDVVRDAVMVSLSGRIHLDETSESTPERVLTEIWENHFVLGPRRAKPG
jgi:MoxR-like ATPase